MQYLNSSGQYEKMVPHTIASDNSCFLSTETAGLFGLGTDAMPDEVLAWIGKYNQHWWRRRTPSYYEAVVGEYAPQAICQYSSFVGASAKTATIYYSDNISIDSAGKITLVDPVTTTVSYDTYTNANVLSGKYFRYYLLEDYATGTNLSGIYLADLGTASRANNVYVGSSEEYGMNVTFNGAPLTSEWIEGGTWEYLHSSNRSAYPDSGTSDGYEYEYLGVPFLNAVGALKAESGSYVGTGTAGEPNPNSLTFEIAPKLVLCAGEDIGNTMIWWSGLKKSNNIIGATSSGAELIVTVAGKTLTWYNADKSKYSQLNVAGKSYHYLAIGNG